MRTFLAPMATLLLVGLAAGCGGDEESGSSSASFENVPWVLASGIDVGGWEAVAPSATFADGRVGGSTGCNRFSAPYTVDGNDLDLGAIAATMMACAPPADAVEKAYVAALEKVGGWRASGEDGLALLDTEGSEVLAYVVATPVGEWQLTGLWQGDAVSSPIAGTEITATFDEDGKVAGSAGCNRYRATFTTDRGAITITAPAGTRMACSKPAGVMAQESAYLAALPDAVRYSVSGRSLELLSADGTRVASYSRSS